MNKVALAARHAANYVLQQTHLKTGLSVGKPTYVYAALVQRCHLKCAHCNFWNMPYDRHREMTTEQWFRVTDELVDWLGQGARIQFTGGEPFLRPDVMQILRHAVEAGALAGVISNGTLLDERKCRELAEMGLFNINFSLDGFSPATHDRIRGVDGAFDKTCQTIRRINQFRVAARSDTKLILKCVMMGINAAEWVNLAQYAQDEGVTGVLFQPLQQNFGEPGRNDWHINNPLWFSDEQLPAVDEALQQLIAMVQNGYPIMNSVEHLESIRHYVRNPIREMKTGETCEVGITNFNIYDDGGVSLCYKMDIIGNVKYNSPEAVWLSHEARERRSEILACREECLITCQLKRGLIERAKLFMTLMGS
ncbi:MAG: radical SAM protein [Candidatus Sericytochromatia bacterium]|nr:radical SAM protein [Candidatus Sericytochromatia bacterium]